MRMCVCVSVCDYESRRNRVNRKAVFTFFGAGGGKSTDRIACGARGGESTVYFLFVPIYTRRRRPGIRIIYIVIIYVLLLFFTIDRDIWYYNDTNIHVILLHPVNRNIFFFLSIFLPNCRTSVLFRDRMSWSAP